MNTLSSYTLASRPQTSRFLRLWALLLRGTFSSAIFLLDVVLIVSMSCATGLAYSLAAYRNAGDVYAFVQVGVLAASIFAISNLFRGEYRLPNFFAVKPHARRTIQLWNVTLICLLLLGFLTQIGAQYSRAWIVLFYATTLGVLIFERFLVVRITAHARAAGLVSAQRIFVIGTGAHVSAFINYYEPWTLGINIVGARFITPVAATATNAERRAALDQDLAEATASVRGVEPDAIFLLLPWSATATIERCADAFLTLPVEIHLGPEQILHKFEDVELSKLGPLASLQLTRMPLTTFEVMQKRLFDLVFAAIALLALTPLLIAVAVLISLDSPGPVFFVQRRFGFNQQPFRIIKFRTMRTLDDGAVVPQAVRDDPRLTRVGRWLRRWNIDEIPQLFNVLTGDMSLVGPRPHALSHDREYEQRISLYARRHNVKPGITGWAQINGYRGVTDTDDKMRKRVEYDLFHAYPVASHQSLHLVSGNIERLPYRQRRDIVVSQRGTVVVNIEFPTVFCAVVLVCSDIDLIQPVEALTILCQPFTLDPQPRVFVPQHEILPDCPCRITFGFQRGDIFSHAVGKRVDFTAQHLAGLSVRVWQPDKHDLFYIDNWSLWLDLKIIARTVLSPTAYRNAC